MACAKLVARPHLTNHGTLSAHGQPRFVTSTNQLLIIVKAQSIQCRSPHLYDQLTNKATHKDTSVLLDRHHWVNPFLKVFVCILYYLSSMSFIVFCIEQHFVMLIYLLVNQTSSGIPTMSCQAYLLQCPSVDYHIVINNCNNNQCKLNSISSA